MALRSKLPNNIYRNYFLAADYFDSFLNKLQVVTDSTAVIYSIRILIVMLALLMAYVQSPEKNEDISSLEKTEIMRSDAKSIIRQIK